MKFIKLISLLFITSYLYALPMEITYGEFGIGFDHPNTSSYSDVKNFELGQQIHGHIFDFKEGIGLWTDVSHYDRARSSPYMEALVGVEPRSSHCYMHYLIGPSLIARPDTLLGSYFQIAHEFGFGFRDSRDTRVGIVIKHFSDAGLSKNNYGRNFVGVEIGFP